MECTLIQWGDDPLRHHYIDADGRMACTVCVRPPCARARAVC